MADLALPAASSRGEFLKQYLYAGWGIVALVGAAREPSFVEPELPVPGVVRILDQDHIRQAVCVPIREAHPTRSVTQTGMGSGWGLWVHQKRYG